MRSRRGPALRRRERVRVARQGLGLHRAPTASTRCNCVPGSAAEIAGHDAVREADLRRRDVHRRCLLHELRRRLQLSAPARSPPRPRSTASTSGSSTAAARSPPRRVAPGNIDLGTSDPNPPLNTNTDCAPATRESPPDSGPVIRRHRRHPRRAQHLLPPQSDQPEGAGLPAEQRVAEGGRRRAPVPRCCIVNLPPACNAFWQGTTGSLNFTQADARARLQQHRARSPTSSCTSWATAWIRTTPPAPRPSRATGEAMGDTFALLQGQHSCIGPGLLARRSGQPLGQPGRLRHAGRRLCTGVRDARLHALLLPRHAAGLRAPRRIRRRAERLALRLHAAAEPARRRHAGALEPHDPAAPSERDRTASRTSTTAAGRRPDRLCRRRSTTAATASR